MFGNRFRYVFLFYILFASVFISSCRKEVIYESSIVINDTINIPRNKQLEFLWFTDIHGDSKRLDGILNYYTKHSDLIDFMLHTGDNVMIQYDDQSFESLPLLNNFKYVLNSVGNHDAYIPVQNNNSDWWAVSKTECYNKFFSPYVANWNVVQPDKAAEEGKMYYYKDLKNNYRLIVLDGHSLTSENVSWFSHEQITWLKDVLDDALVNAKKVIIANHYPPGHVKNDINTPFNTSNPGTFWETSNKDFGILLPSVYKEVSKFIDEGGFFVCWLVGHVHRNIFSHIAEDDRQLVIATPNAGFTGFAYTEDYTREYDTESEYLFSIIAFDNNKIYLKRVGAKVKLDGNVTNDFYYKDSSGAL